MDDAHTHSGKHGLGTISGVKLLVDRCEVVLDRLLADEQLLGDLWGRASVSDELENFFLTLGDDALLLRHWLVHASNLVQHGRSELRRERRVAGGCHAHC